MSSPDAVTSSHPRVDCRLYSLHVVWGSVEAIFWSGELLYSVTTIVTRIVSVFPLACLSVWSLGTHRASVTKIGHMLKQDPSNVDTGNVVTSYFQSLTNRLIVCIFKMRLRKSHWTDLWNGDSREKLLLCTLILQLHVIRSFWIDLEMCRLWICRCASGLATCN